MKTTLQPPRAALASSCCLLLVLAAASHTHAAVAQDVAWTKVRSKHFTLVGDADEREIKRVAARLEQFRHVVARLFRDVRVGPSPPTTVVVFKSYDTYGPFRFGESSGYFQPGDDTNYITLTTERRHGDDDSHSVVYHEYMHLLVRENMPNAPLWLSEGLGEYYSTFQVSGERRVLLGRPVDYHVRQMRAQKFLPLRTLFSVDHKSPHYHERSKRGVFYAQSWALVHYFLCGGSDVRREQFERYMSLLAGGRTSEQALSEAFGDDLNEIESELQAYVSLKTRAGRVFKFDERLKLDAEITSELISEAAALAHLGDLLLHVRRNQEAEDYLRRALALEPQLAQARTSLAVLRIRQSRLDEARRELDAALEGGARSHLAHYYYAYVLGQVREGRSRSGGYLPETVGLMRAHLKRAIELAPEYSDAYDLLASVELAAGDLVDADALLKRASALAPGRAEKYALTLAQVHMHRGDYRAARQLVEPIAQKSYSDTLRRHAAELLNAMRAQEELDLRRAVGATAFRVPGGDVQEDDEELVFETPVASQVRPKAEGQEQARGDLVDVECTNEGVFLRLVAEGRVLKFRTDNFERVPFVSYDPAMARGNGRRLSCGTRNAANHVLLTYRPLNNNLKADGEVVAVDFIPREWR